MAAADSSKPGSGLPSSLNLSGISKTGTPAQNASVSAALPVPLATDQMVYMGKNAQGADQWQTVTDAKRRFVVLANQEVAALQQAAIAVYGKPLDQKKLKSGWEDAVQIGGSYKAAYGKDMDPFTAFKWMLERNKANGLGADGKVGGGAGGGPTSSTTKSVKITDPSTARGLVDSALSTYLGRRATSSEQAVFMKALNNQERQNATITKQTTNTAKGDGGTTVGSNVETTGGFNPSTFAEEYARGQEGAGEYQAATSLLDTFIGALGAKV